MGFEITRTELVWPGKYDENGKRREVERVSLPFQVIERVNESRATRVAKESKNMTLFDYMTPDTAETFEEGWRNKLIWGDNLLVMSSLLDQLAGKVDLIYIDPPFATGADFSFTTPIGEAEQVSVHKQQSVIEEKAYRDTWGKDESGDTKATYLQMVNDRLLLMYELLRPSGTIVVHLDYRVDSHVRMLLDEIFGADRLRNSIAWCYTGPSRVTRDFPDKHDTLWRYTRGPDYYFDSKVPEVRIGYVKSLRAASKATGIYSARQEDLQFDEYDRRGKLAEDWWSDITPVGRIPTEDLKYPTQKPEKLLARIIASSCPSGGLVADLFAGSGTTPAVAEKLGRRWIAADLGRFAIHTTRKRLLGIEGCKPFEVLNLGRYERQYWSSATFGTERKGGGVTSIFEYVAFVLKLYRASPAVGLQHLHGRVGAAFVHVGAVDAPVTIDEIAACITECVALKASELHVLGWEWEMGLHDPMTDEAKARGVKLVLRQIPRELMERQAADKGDVTFFELAYLEVAVTPAKGKHQVVATLADFVIPNPELVPEEVQDKITKWSDYVDYWAVDWDFAGDTFMQGWVTYRTRKDRSLALQSDPHTYEGPGEHAVMVKVIDIFGNDTSRILTVKVT
ncbi:MAG: DNA methyltransferase [Acidimicrobiales bacterium]